MKSKMVKVMDEEYEGVKARLKCKMYHTKPRWRA